MKHCIFHYTLAVWFSFSFVLGYDMHHDLVSPMLTQTMVTDGRLFTPVTFRLDTLRLFVPDTANEKYNSYSVGETAQLYHKIDDDGNVSIY